MVFRSLTLFKELKWVLSAGYLTALCSTVKNMRNNWNSHTHWSPFSKARACSRKGEPSLSHSATEPYSKDPICCQKFTLCLCMRAREYAYVRACMCACVRVFAVGKCAAADCESIASQWIDRSGLFLPLLLCLILHVQKTWLPWKHCIQERGCNLLCCCVCVFVRLCVLRPVAYETWVPV